MGRNRVPTIVVVGIYDAVGQFALGIGRHGTADLRHPRQRHWQRNRGTKHHRRQRRPPAALFQPGSMTHLQNQTANGTLIQGYDSVANQTFSDLEARVAEALTMSLL